MKTTNQMALVTALLGIGIGCAQDASAVDADPEEAAQDDATESEDAGFKSVFEPFDPGNPDEATRSVAD